MRLTKGFVDKLTAPTDKNQVFYRDDELKGFAVRVTSSGSKSFIVEKLIANQVKRITLGKYGALSVEQARKEAQKMIGQIAMGKDPVAEKKAARIKGVTLKQVVQEYFESRSTLKPKTLYDYRRIYEVAFEKWHNKALTEITKNMIETHHKYLGEHHGEAYANLTMRFLRALFNFASAKYEDAQGKSLITENPTKRLSQTRSWYRVERRKTMIKAHELAAWYQGVTRISEDREEENASMWQDYFLLILFTGLRRSEAGKLTTANLDFKAKTFTIYDTKNYEEHTLPMSDFLYQLLERRVAASKTSEFLFPANSKSGYVVEPRKAIDKIIKFSGI